MVVLISFLFFLKWDRSFIESRSRGRWSGVRWVVSRKMRGLERVVKA